MSNLPSGTHVLSGIESQRLRAFCSSETFSASDLDDFAILLQNAEIEETKIPVFNFILQLTILNPPSRPRYLQIARYLALEAEVPVDITDLSGTTTFMYSISTKPYWDKEFAEIMLQGGAQVNQRNRYGCTAAHDIVMARDFSTEGKMKTFDALTFFVEKGGDLDIKDGDGVSARTIGKSVMRMVPELGFVINPTSGHPSMPTAGHGTTAGTKIGRNDPCRCGSKKKYKVCCGKN
ncbi:uncharacterized protein LY89DRAFT_783089 [Mollisia scopiformis]|uniref:Uncharacterized protein n=1 Tax=Mollisia scopiformis TaxID=149040 RepID=A0A194X6L7_MOLSC|nr:uncharacterized protein LY89DRAFT_783089 [Mollisia scopiformis]KUJ15820.1 hypothetical protein LY89DRAFT_783089 [Mollisia scopiformis]